MPRAFADSKIFPVLGLLLGCLQAPASAAITPVVMNRGVQVVVQPGAPGIDGPNSPYAGAGAWTDQVSVDVVAPGEGGGTVTTFSAWQQSTIDVASGRFQGDGTASFGNGPANAVPTAVSAFTVLFELDQAYDYQMAAHLLTGSDTLGAEAYFLLQSNGLGGTVFAFDVQGGEESPNLSGTLAPGQYWLTAGAEAGQSGQAQFGRNALYSFLLELKPREGPGGTVPEPPLLALLGLAVLALHRRPRRQLRHGGRGR